MSLFIHLNRFNLNGCRQNAVNGCHQTAVNGCHQNESLNSSTSRIAWEWVLLRGDLLIKQAQVMLHHAGQASHKTTVCSLLLLRGWESVLLLFFYLILLGGSGVRHIAGKMKRHIYLNFKHLPNIICMTGHASFSPCTQRHVETLALLTGFVLTEVIVQIINQC